MRNPYIGKGRSELREAMMRLKGADIYTPRAAVQIDDAFKATEAAMPQGMQASYQQQRGEALAKLTDSFQGEMKEIRDNQEFGDLVVDNINDQRQTLNKDEELGLSTLIDTITTGGMGSRMADERVLQQRLNNILQDAKKAVDYNNANKQAFINAGVPASRYNDEIGLIREGDRGKVPLYGKFLDTGFDELTPAPYVAPEGDYRVHTRYVDNPVTGVPQIVPMMDSERPGKALVSPYGEIKRNSTEATEAAQLYLLKLMESNPKKYASQNRNPDWYSDFQATINGETSNIDGMVREVTGNFKDTVNIPIYMNLRPGNKGQRTIYNRDENSQLREDVKSIVKDKVQNPRNISSITAVDNLIKEGNLIAPAMDKRIGKVLRNDIERVGSRAAQYDQLMVTGYDKSDRVIKNFKKPLTRTEEQTVVRPRTAHLVNLDVVRDVEERIKGVPFRLRTQTNGNTGRPFDNEAYNSKLSGQYRMNDSHNGKPLSVDVFSQPQFASVHQALEQLKYK